MIRDLFARRRAASVGSPSPSPTSGRRLRAWHVGVVCTATVGALVAGTPAGASSPERAQSQACRSCIVMGVNAVSPKAAWLVGFRGGPGTYRTWVRQWNGRHWHNATTPDPGTSNELFGVSATSPSDAWSVGYYFAHHSSMSLLEHWDGSAWTAVPGPLQVSSPLFDVDMVSSTDGWAVGNFVSGGQHSLILHWDGSSWTQVDSPDPSGATDITLRKITADASNDAWALGTYRLSNNRGGAQNKDNGNRSFMLHWDGTSWSLVQNSPQYLLDVSADASSDAWAVGSSSDLTLAERWNGSQWSQVSTPNPGQGVLHVLQGVNARTPSDAWAVGYYDVGDSDAAMILHWDGSTWTDTQAQSPSNSYLYGVSADAANDAWAVGETRGSGKTHLLLEHWDGSTWTQF